MESSEQKTNNNQTNKHFKPIKQHTSQKLFKYLSYAIAVICLICLPNFINFRRQAQTAGLTVISSQSFWWLPLSFFVSWILKTTFKTLLSPIIIKLMPFDMQQEKGDQSNQKMFKKAIFDLAIHITLSTSAFILFHQQYWFTYLFAGSGNHNELFREYPNRLSHMAHQVQIYNIIQLGFNIYVLFDLLFINRVLALTKNFYEGLLHHISAVLAIVIAIGSNLSALSILIYFVHDSSDAMRSLSKVYSECRFSKVKYSLWLQVAFICCWIYTRMIVFPFCLINKLYEHLQELNGVVLLIKTQLMLFIGLLCSLFLLHVFWAYLLARQTFKKIKRYRRFCRQIQNKKQ